MMEREAVSVALARLRAACSDAPGGANDLPLPTFRAAEVGVPKEGLDRLVALSRATDRIASVVDGVAREGCSYDLDHLPHRLGVKHSKACPAKRKGAP